MMEFSSISERHQNIHNKGVQASPSDIVDGEKKEDADVVTTEGQDGDQYAEVLSTRGVVKDSKFAWVKCFAAFTIQVVIVGVLHCFGVFFVEFIEEFNTTKAEAAWAGSLAYGVTMVLGPLATAVIMRLGVRGSIIMGSLLCAVSMLISSAMTSMSWLYLTFSLLYGIGCCLAYSPTMTIAEDYFIKYLSVATGITVSGSSMGTLIFNPASQAMVDAIGWRATFRVLAGFCSIGAICGLAFEGRPPTETPAGMVQKSPLRRLVADLHLWKNKVYIVYVAGLTLVMFGYYIPYVHMVSHAMQLGIPASKGSIIIMLLGASTATGRILFGKIITFGILDRLHMHQLSMVITGMACMMLPLIKTFGGLLAYVVCVGLVDGCFVVMMPLLTVTLAGVENKINAWGYVVCFTGITFTLGPPAAGWIFDATGSYNMAFHIAGIPILLGAAVMFFIPWAQRTANRKNDALSTAGDIYYVTASASMYSDSQSVLAGDNLSHISHTSQTGSVLSMWAAPSHLQSGHRGSMRSSLRGSTFSIDSKGPLDNLRERGPWKRTSPSVDIQDVQVTFPGGQGGMAISPGTEYLTTTPKGRRARSLSESSNGRDHRGVQWVDQVDYTQKLTPTLTSDPTTGQSDDHRPSSLRRDQTTKSEQDLMISMCKATVEVRDDVMGIFMETITGRPPQVHIHARSTNPSIVTQASPTDSSSTSPVPGSGQLSNRSSDMNGGQRSGNTSPVAIGTHPSTPVPIPSPKMWASPLGSPRSPPLQFMNSPPATSNTFDANNQAPVVQVPPALGSPKLSGHLLTIPEGKRIPDNVQEIEQMLQNTLQQQQFQQYQQNGNVPEANAATQTSFDAFPQDNESAPLNASQEAGFVHYNSPDNTQPFQPTNPFLQKNSDPSISTGTSSVSINQSPRSSNSLFSPDAQVIFPMDSDSGERNNVDDSGQNKS